MLLLGAAYGILEEGLMVKSFFDPNWMDLGILGSFGRWMNVNWVWAEMLIIYHAVFSITIPVVLVELVYPERKNERWVSNRLFKALISVLIAVTAFGFYFLTAYRPPLPQYAMAIVAMSLFTYVAYKLPARKTNDCIKRMRKARNLFIIFCLGSFAFFLLFYSGPYVINSPPVIMLLGAVLILGATKYLVRFDWTFPQTALNRLAVVGGSLSFMILLAFLMEFKGIVGMSVVSIAAIVALLLLKRRMKAHC